MTIPDWIAVTLKVIDALDSLGVPYAIGGSAASIIHGTVRSTLDSDLIADLRSEHVDRLVAILEDEFYIEPTQVREAILSQSSFNLIHQLTMFKVDIFVPKTREFEHSQLSRRVEIEVLERPSKRAWISSAEDTILAKLEWYKLGGEVSERQWRDVLGVLKVQEGRLDFDYLERMAKAMKIDTLLSMAVGEAGKS